MRCPGNEDIILARLPSQSQNYWFYFSEVVVGLEGEF